jgi:hypothetical protein
MTLNRFFGGLALTALLAVVPARAGTASICDAEPGNIVLNCGFETGDLTDWTVSGNNTWNFITSDSHSGNFAWEAGPNPPEVYISQTLDTVAGQSYTLSFWLEVSATPANQFEAWWNSTQSGTPVLDLINAPVAPYTEYQFTVTASSSSTNLEFGTYNSPGHFLLDDISVVPLTGPEIPEPESLGLAVLGSLVLFSRAFRSARAGQKH